MNSWLQRATKLIEKSPHTRNVLYTNLQLYNNSQKFDNLIEDWTNLFKLSLNDLLRVKGIVRYVDDSKDIEELEEYLSAG